MENETVTPLEPGTYVPAGAAENAVPVDTAPAVQPRKKHKKWWIPVACVLFVLLAVAGLYFSEFLTPVDGNAVLGKTLRAFAENYRELAMPAAAVLGEDNRTVISGALPREIGNRKRDVTFSVESGRTDEKGKVRFLYSVGTNKEDLEFGADGKEFWVAQYNEGSKYVASSAYRYRVGISGAAKTLENSRLNPAVDAGTPFSEEEYDSLREFFELLEDLYSDENEDREVSFEFSKVQEKLKSLGTYEKSVSFPTAATLVEGLQGFRPIKTLKYSIDADGLADTVAYALELSENTKDGRLLSIVNLFSSEGSEGEESPAEAIRASQARVSVTVSVQGNRLRSAHAEITSFGDAAAEQGSVHVRSKTEMTTSADLLFRYAGKNMAYMEFRMDVSDGLNGEKQPLIFRFRAGKIGLHIYTSTYELEAEGSSSVALEYGKGNWTLKADKSTLEGTYRTEGKASAPTLAEYVITSASVYHPSVTLNLDTGLTVKDAYLALDHPLTWRMERCTEDIAAPRDAVLLSSMTEEDERNFNSMASEIRTELNYMAEPVDPSERQTLEGYPVLPESKYDSASGSMLAAVERSVINKYGLSASLQVYIPHEDPEYYWLVAYDPNERRIYYSICVKLTPEITAVYRPAEIQNGYVVYK